MQHSGAPTRLSDWTEGGLIALYFAVRNNANRDSDTAVWILDPWELNRTAADRAEVIGPGAETGLFKSDGDYYAPWLPARYEEAESLKKNCQSPSIPRISQDASVHNDHASPYTVRRKTASAVYRYREQSSRKNRRPKRITPRN